MKKVEHIISALSFPHVIDDLIIPFQISNEEVYPDRLAFLVDAVKGKRVLHLGCCDHIDIIEQKIANNIWLHGLLCDASELCYGIDNNQEAVDFLTNKGWKNIYCADISRGIPEEVRQQHFDVMILGEILEHINDPAAFLKQLHSFFDYEYTLIITVPNAFTLDNWKNVMNNFERINSDHRYWFTPYTISKICYEGGYKTKNVNFVYRSSETKYGIGSDIDKSLFRYYPGFRDVLVVEASSTGDGLKDKINPEIPELNKEDIYSLFRWDSSPESCKFRSFVKNTLYSLERSWNTSVYDRNLQMFLAEQERIVEENQKLGTDLQTVTAQKNTQSAQLTDALRANEKMSAELGEALKAREERSRLQASLDEAGKREAELRSGNEILKNTVAERDRTVVAVTTENNHLKNSLTEYEKSVAEVRSGNEELKKLLAEQEKMIAVLTLEKEQLSSRLAETGKTLSKTEEVLSKKNDELAVQQKALQEVKSRMARQDSDIASATRENIALQSQLNSLKQENLRVSADLLHMTGHSQYLSAELTKKIAEAEEYFAEAQQYQTRYFRLCAKIRKILKKILFLK